MGSPHISMGIALFLFFSVTHKIGLFSPRIWAIQTPWRTSPHQNLGNNHTAPANQELGKQEKGQLLPLTSLIEGVVQPKAPAVAHSATVGARWEQRRGCGGFTSTICEWANASAFERHRLADVRVFVLG